MCIELLHLIFYILAILSAYWLIAFLFFNEKKVKNKTSFIGCFLEKVNEKREETEDKKIDVLKDILKNCVLGYFETRRERRIQAYIFVLTLLLCFKIYFGLSDLLVEAKNIKLDSFFPWIIPILFLLVSIQAVLTTWKRDILEKMRDQIQDADKKIKLIKERFFDYAMDLAILFALTIIFQILAPLFGLEDGWILFIELVLIFWFVTYLFFIVHHFRELFH